MKGYNLEAVLDFQSVLSASEGGISFYLEKDNQVIPSESMVHSDPLV